MPYVPIKPPNGLMLNGTEYDAQGRWRLANLVRFFRGSPQPVGGWTRLPLTWKDGDGKAHNLDQLVGACRGIVSWRDNSEKRWLAIGTTRALYAFDGSEIFDITPAGLLPGDENANYGSGYGAYFYSEDHDDPEAHTGGTAAYSTERPAAITSLVQEPGAWTFDTWGEDLIACPNWDGKMYAWTPGDAVAIKIYTTPGEVPESVRATLVSNERHLIAIGAGAWGGAVWDKDQRQIMWSTSEDREDWVPAIDNSAGDLRLQSKGIAIAGAKFRGEILIWTDIDVHRMVYIGAPYYYGLKKISPVAGCLSVNAYVTTSEFVFWVGPRGFYIYDGSVRNLDPDVSDHYRDSLNTTQIAKVACGHNPKFKEIWVFFPSKGSDENDSYIIWNYEDNTWTIGDLNRTCWDEALIWDYPMATSAQFREAISMNSALTLDTTAWFGFVEADVWLPAFWIDPVKFGDPAQYNSVENVVVNGLGGTPVYVENTDYEIDYILGMIKILSTGSIGVTGVFWYSADIIETYLSEIFNHEDGYTNGGESRDVWLELSPFEISMGDNLAVVNRIIQDTGREDDLDPALNSNAIEVSFKTRLAPEAVAIVEGPYTLDTDRGYTDVRFTGRQVSMKVQQVKDELWRLGKFRLDVKSGSGR